MRMIHSAEEMAKEDPDSQCIRHSVQNPTLFSVNDIVRWDQRESTRTDYPVPLVVEGREVREAAQALRKAQGGNK